MFTDEESSDFSVLEEDFPFCVQIETVGRNRGAISLTNRRDAPIIFKSMVSDPDSIILKPTNGKLNGKDSISIRVLLKKKQNDGESDCPIKFLVNFADLSSGGGDQCDCALRSLGLRVFEKTVWMPFDGGVGILLNQQVKLLYENLQWKAKENFQKISNWNSHILKLTVTMIFLGSALAFLLHLTRGQICKQPTRSWIHTLTSYFSICNIPIISKPQYCWPTWKDTLTSKLCDF